MIEEFTSVGSVFHILGPYVHHSDRNEKYLHFDDYYGLYYDIARKTKPTSILEIGVRFGYSAIIMLAGVDGEASYYGFDNQSYGEHDPNIYALEQIRKVCKRHASIAHVNTQKVDRLDVPGPCDLIHVDGAHSYRGVMNDLNLVYKYAHSDTHIIVDDTEHPPEAGDACNEWADENGFDRVHFPVHCGRTVLKKNGNH